MGIGSRFLCVLLVLVQLTTLSGCSTEIEEHTGELFAMNTLISVQIWGSEGKSVLRETENYLYTLEQEFSTTRNGSEVNLLNDNSGEWHYLSDHLFSVLQYAHMFSLSTQGAFDPTVYPLVKAWGFTQENYRVPSEEEIQSLLTLVDVNNVSYDDENQGVFLVEGAELDFGGIAKGYAVDQLVAMYRENKVETALVSLGGNIYAYGKKIDGSLWTIGVQNPYGGGSVGSIQVENKAVITSGSYQRFFTLEGNTYSHLIDPRTGYPADSGLASVTIVCDSGIYGDCLSTALFVMGLEDSIAYHQEHQDFDGIFIDTQGDIYITPGLESTFVLAKGYQGNLQVITYGN